MRNDRKEGNYSPHQSKKVFPKKYLFSSQNNGSFYQKQRLVLSKTTARFTKNNGSFYRKQRLVLLKTTARFTENNGSFYQKRRLVLSKITACFTKNDGSFYQEQRLVLLKTTAWFTTKKNKCRSFCSNFSPYPHPILLFHKPSQGKNCANTTNLRRNKSHNTK